MLPIISWTGLSCIICAAFDGEQIFLLGGESLGAIDRHQGFALGHLAADEIHEDLLEPAFELAVHLRDSGLVERDARHGAQRTRDTLVVRGAVLHADELLLFGRDLHSAFGQAIGLAVVARLVPGEYGDQFHAAIGCDAGLVALVPGMHRVHPVERLLFRGRRFGVPASEAVAAGPGGADQDQRK